MKELGKKALRAAAVAATAGLWLAANMGAWFVAPRRAAVLLYASQLLFALWWLCGIAIALRGPQAYRKALAFVGAYFADDKDIPSKTE